MRKSFLRKCVSGDARIKEKGLAEDATEYGEFIASFDAWMTPEEQKKRAEHQQNLSEKKK